MGDSRKPMVKLFDARYTEGDAGWAVSIESNGNSVRDIVRDLARMLNVVPSGDGRTEAQLRSDHWQGAETLRAGLYYQFVPLIELAKRIVAHAKERRYTMIYEGGEGVRSLWELEKAIALAEDTPVIKVPHG